MPLRLPIADPCAESWAAMSGDETRRFCERCEKHVHDVSAMTPRQAARFAAAAAGKCVRYLTDGREIVHLAPAPRSGASRFPAAAGLLVTVLASCAPHGAETPVPELDVPDASPRLTLWTVPAAEVPIPDPSADEPCEPPVVEEQPLPKMGGVSARPLMGKPGPARDLEPILGWAG